MNDIFQKLLDMSIKGSFLILAVILLRFALKRAPKWINSVLWAMVALRLICPFSLESALSLVPRTAQPAAVTVQSAEPAAVSQDFGTFNSTTVPVVGSGTYTPLPAVSENTAEESREFPYGLVWAAGTAAMLIFAAVSYISLRRRVREAVPVLGGVWICDAVKSPFILGILKPRIYLSSSIDPGQIDYVIAHEKAHLRYRDNWWKPLGYVLLSVYWFNPLVWAAYILFCRDIELACDERVIRTLGMAEKKAYSHALLACSMQRKMLLTYPLAFGEVGVRERVKSVLTYKKPGFWLVLVSVAACAAVAVCFLTTPVSASEGEASEQSEALTPIISSRPDEITEFLPENTDYSQYDALIEEARYAIENLRGQYPDPEKAHFSNVFYAGWDYEVLGYMLLDIDGNGVEELIFGENAADPSSGWDGIIYDLYTISEGELVHLVSGWERSRYYLCENGCIAHEGSGSAFEGCYNYFELSGSELIPTDTLIFNINMYNERQWYYSAEYTSEISEAEPIDEAAAEEIMEKYVYVLPQFTPFAETADTAVKLYSAAVAEMYEGGKMLVDVEKEFLEIFSQADISDGTLLWRDSAHNILVYGFDNETHTGTGLIFDLGGKGVFRYAIPYASASNLTPVFSYNEAENALFMQVLANHGTGVSVWELYIFKLDDMENPVYIDTAALVDCINQHITAYYDTKSAVVTLYWDGEAISEAQLSITPVSLFNGFIVSYEISDDVLVSVTPTFMSDNPGEFGYAGDITLTMQFGADSTFTLER